MHINELPEDLAENILMRLPIQEAVKTSVLSKKWRYDWRKLPELVFDEEFCDESIRNMKSKLIAAIFQVLLLHRGPLQSFALSLPELGGCSEIDQFMLVVLEAGVKVFILHIGEGEPYRLPSSIFTYGQQLERLSLRSCVIKPPPEFEGFGKLTELVLDEVGISGSVVSSLIRNCLLLEAFYLYSSTNCGCLQIFSPNLKILGFTGLCESLCFVNTPNLDYVLLVTSDIAKYDPRKQIEASSQPILSGRLPVCEVLTVDSLYSKSMKGMLSAANELCHLKTLNLLSMSFGILDEVSAALCLIRNCKNLEELKIAMRPIHNTHDIELKEVEGFSNVTLDHLREVKLYEISGRTGMKCEMQLIELILAKAPVLEKFVIKLDSWLDESERLRIFNELAMFRRAAPQRAVPLVEVD